MSRGNFTKTLITTTHGLFETLTDLTLFMIFLTGGILGFRSRRDLLSAFQDAVSLLEKVNYKTFIAALNALKKREFITEIKIHGQQIFLTSMGKSYLSNLLPPYRTRRIWEGKIYLVTYDIPETRRFSRDLLRKYLKQDLSAAFLQRSVFLTPFNPRRSLAKFAQIHRIHGTILISELDKNGTIGGSTLPLLLRKLYRLDDLQKRYQKFIEKWQKPQKAWNRFELEFDFRSILKDDSQLPFQLLPPNFPSSKAYAIYRKLFESRNR